MKILIVNTTDILGGAARAAYRLHRALIDEGVESQMLVQRKISDDFTVAAKHSKLQQGIRLLRPTLDTLPLRFYGQKADVLFSPAWLPFGGIVDMIKEIDPDIVHLHWICGGMIRIEDLQKINAPIVWSLHDMWAFTGGCHYSSECQKYMTQCGACPVLGSSKENDLSNRVFQRKEKVFANTDMTIVGLSSWLNDCSKSSELLKNKKHFNLPNPINTEVFKPLGKESAREIWRLPKDKKLVLFGAMGAASDPRKGFAKLEKALRQIEREDIALVVFGSSKPQNAPDLGFEAYYVGSLSDDVSLGTLYSAVDVMVVPSMQENLSNAIMESLSCAIPVVAFDIGGNGDMILHQTNGYLAHPYDVSDLAKGIEWILDMDTDKYTMVSHNAREKVLKEFDSKVVAHRYISLYEEILGAR